MFNLQHAYIPVLRLRSMLPYSKDQLRNYFSGSRYIYCFIIINGIITVLTLYYNYNLSLVSVQLDQIPVVMKFITKSDNTTSEPTSATKYILLWTNPKYLPFSYFSEGKSIFIKKKCKWNNCYVTGERNLLDSYSKFDVIAFNGPQLSDYLYTGDLPIDRQHHQKYVYANIEAAANYPIFTKKFDGYFNWTWTYKLNSDAIWGYMVVKDSNNNVIGPREDMHWINIDNMAPIEDRLKIRLKTKKKAAVWFSSNCNTKSHREDLVQDIKKYLFEYNLTLDVFGSCGSSQCPKQIIDRCLKVVQKRYYFFIAFENALCDDYVTEKVVYALKHDTVPIVYGGANYSKFMPEGIYLNALKLGPKKLAKKMFDIIQNSSKYESFFKWKKHYSYHFKHENPDTDDYCKFCEMLNNKSLMNTYSVYENFSRWWTPRRSYDLAVFNY